MKVRLETHGGFNFKKAVKQENHSKQERTVAQSTEA